MEESKELEKVNQVPDVQIDRDLIDEEIEGVQISFEQIKIEKDGTGYFQIGEFGDRVKEFTGYIVFTSRFRLYYEDTEGEPVLVCRSLDGIRGFKVDTGEPCDCGCQGICARCLFNQWGSGRAKSGGKACRELRLLIIRSDQYSVPLSLVLPPTSLTRKYGYNKWRSLLFDGTRILSNLEVKARFSLEVTSGQYGKFSRVIIVPAEWEEVNGRKRPKIADPEEVRINRSLHDMIRASKDQVLETFEESKQVEGGEELGDEEVPF